MFTSNPESTRTLTLELPETEWRALRTVEPNAVGWLQELIRQRLAEQGATTTSGPCGTASAETWWGDDY